MDEHGQKKYNVYDRFVTHFVFLKDNKKPLQKVEAFYLFNNWSYVTMSCLDECKYNVRGIQMDCILSVGKFH